MSCEQILECMYVRQALDLLDGLIPASDQEMSAVHLQKLIVFAVMWSLGAVLEIEDRKKVRCVEMLFRDMGVMQGD